MSKHHGVIISDIHVGAIPAPELYDQLNSTFFNYIEHNPTIDYIVICGDFFDSKLYLNSPHSEMAVRIMNRIYGYAKELNAKLRIVYGTESHEVNQYIIFDDLVAKNEVDFRIIKTAEEEQLFSDMKVLYLPEELIWDDKKEYYKEFLGKEQEYDYIFGHGVIQEVMTEAVRHSSSTKKRAAPAVFTTNDFEKICKGNCFFGHYHVHVDITDKISYIGSYSRWKFGEEPDKGFFVAKKDDDEYSSKFIINDYCDKYITIAYGYNSKIFSSEEAFSKEMEIVAFRVKENKNNHIRLMVNIPEGLPWANYVMEYLKGRFSMEEMVKVNIVNGYIEKRDQIDKEQISEILDKYEFIFNRDLGLEEKCSKFIQVKFGRSLEVERIRHILHDIFSTG